MPRLADTDVGAAYGFARSIVGAQTEAELQRRALQALAELVPADVLTWDRVELATGAVYHEATPAGAEPPGAFDALVRHAGDHPLLAAHAARRRPALRLSEVSEPGALTRGELYARGAHGRRRRRAGAPREPVELGRGVRSAAGIVPPITRRVCAVPEFENPSAATPAAEIGPTITARFKDGPLKGSSIEAEIVEGRPPKTIDAPTDDGSTCRYCLAGWVQSGRSAVYTFLYRV